MSAAPLHSSDKRRPELAPPPGACDAHCHIFGPGAVFPYAPDRRYTPEDAPKEALAQLHDRLGIDRAVLVQASCHGRDNRAMLDAIASRPDVYRGVAIVDDEFSDAEFDELDRGGVRGVRFNFVRHLGGAPDKGMFERVIDRIKDRGWHVVLHLDCVDIEPMADMIAALPLPFVIDHMGRIDTGLDIDQPAFAKLLELARRDDAWIKVCGSERISRFPFDAALPFARALMDVSPDRVLWGTDFPHPNLKEPVDEADLVDLVQRFSPSEEATRRLLVDNPARLYGFSA